MPQEIEVFSYIASFKVTSSTKFPLSISQLPKHPNVYSQRLAMVHCFFSDCHHLIYILFKFKIIRTYYLANLSTCYPMTEILFKVTPSSQVMIRLNSNQIILIFSRLYRRTRLKIIVCYTIF